LQILATKIDGFKNIVKFHLLPEYLRDGENLINHLNPPVRGSDFNVKHSLSGIPLHEVYAMAVKLGIEVKFGDTEIAQSDDRTQMLIIDSEKGESTGNTIYTGTQYDGELGTNSCVDNALIAIYAAKSLGLCAYMRITHTQHGLHAVAVIEYNQEDYASKEALYYHIYTASGVDVEVAKGVDVEVAEFDNQLASSNTRPLDSLYNFFISQQLALAIEWLQYAQSSMVSISPRGDGPNDPFGGSGNGYMGDDDNTHTLAGGNSSTTNESHAEFSIFC